MQVLDVLPVIMYIIKLHNIDNIVKFTLLILFNSIINMVTKNILKQPRPTQNSFSFDTYGMPSGHAQAVWFMVFYNLNKSTNKQNTLLITLAFISCAQRVYTNNHTLEQVLVGSLVGSILGLLASKM